MQVSIVLTIIGADKPGLVQSLSGAIADGGGNWLESRMARLGGQFAGILRVTVDADRADALIADLNALREAGLSVHAERSDIAESGAPARGVLLEFIGHDRPGLIREMTQALARRQINVEQLDTQVISAPMSGEPLFQATAHLRVPADVDDADLRAEIEHIADQLSLDVSLENE
jgi:glycine cleavage system regulatory protein